MQDFDFNINKHKMKDYWILDTFTNEDSIINFTNLTLMYNNYPFMSLIFNHYNKNIIVSVRLLGTFRITNFNEYSGMEKKSELLDIIISEKIADMKTQKLENFLDNFNENIYVIGNYEDVLVNMLNDCYCCGILDNIPIFNLVCYYNIFKTLNYEILDQDYNQLNFNNIENLNYIIISQFKDIVSLKLNNLTVEV
mgnify:FL=1